MKLPVFLALPFVLAQADVYPTVIYGEDDRKDLYEFRDARHVDLAASSVALFYKKDLVREADGHYRVKGKNYHKGMKLCPDEPFSSQDMAAFCSGSLVSSRHVLTAGHCFESKKECNDVALAFGFALKAPGAKPSQLPGHDVYHCKRIVALKEKGPRDYALVELDREVEGRPALPLPRSPLEKGDEVFVLGYPTGLPLKLADNGCVRERDDHSYTVNLDTFYNNSGSPVFSARSYELQGILIDGDEDYVWDRKHRCRRAKRCEEDKCEGEGVFRLDTLEEEVRDLLKETS